MLRAAALSLICAVLALTAAGVRRIRRRRPGDPASLVPAGASFYLQAAVQPEGDQREDALAAAGKIMRTDDPAAKLRELIDKALAEEDAGLTWEKDFASWLGEDAGVWATNFAGRRAELRGDRRDEGHRGGEGRARQVRADVRQHLQARAPTTGSTTRSTTRAWRPA